MSHEVDKETACFIDGAMTMPERGWWFEYRDKKHRFFFSADSIYEADGHTYDVTVDSLSFSTERYGVGLDARRPDIETTDLVVIRRNMEKFFHERSFVSSALPIDPRSKFRRLLLK